MADDTLVSLAVAARAAAAAENAVIATWAGAAANALVAIIAVASPWMAARIVRAEREAVRQQVIDLCREALDAAADECKTIAGRFLIADKNDPENYVDDVDTEEFRVNQYFVMRPYYVHAHLNGIKENIERYIDKLNLLKSIHVIDVVNTVEVSRTADILLDMIDLLSRIIEQVAPADPFARVGKVHMQKVEVEMLAHEIQLAREDLLGGKERRRR